MSSGVIDADCLAGELATRQLRITQMWIDQASRCAWNWHGRSEIILSQNLDDATVRQNAKFAVGPTDVALKLKAEIEIRPMVAQFDPGQPTFVAGVQAKAGRQVKIFQAQALLRHINQVRLAGCQFL